MSKPIEVAREIEAEEAAERERRSSWCPEIGERRHRAPDGSYEVEGYYCWLIGQGLPYATEICTKNDALDCPRLNRPKPALTTPMPTRTDHVD